MEGKGGGLIEGRESSRSGLSVATDLNPNQDNPGLVSGPGRMWQLSERWSHICKKGW